MPPLTSAVDPADPEFRANDRHNRALWADARARQERVAAGGGEAAIRRHRDRGKLLPRERIDPIRDPHTAFLELSPRCAEGC